MKVKEMNIEQRPREKALRFGLESLTNLELIALILQSGNKKRDVFDFILGPGTFGWLLFLSPSHALSNICRLPDVHSPPSLSPIPISS